MSPDQLPAPARAALGLVPGPLHPDACGHGGYVATLRVAEPGVPARSYDLYVFRNGQTDAACLRHGPEPEAYLSPGPAGSLANQLDPTCRRAAALLAALAGPTDPWLEEAARVERQIAQVDRHVEVLLDRRRQLMAILRAVLRGPAT